MKMLNGDFSWENLEPREGRANLGDSMPVEIYRLFQYAMRAELAKRYGKEAAIDIFRACGRAAGVEFAQHELDLTAELGAFIAQLQAKLRNMQIGILRFEDFDAASGKAIMTVSEDLDCSGLPVTGECVCNYDEGFIGGILTEYTKKPYIAVEVDCWAKGDRVCRFQASPSV